MAGRTKKTDGQTGAFSAKVCSIRLHDEGNTAKRIMASGGLTIYDVSVCTVTRFVNANGLFYLQTRKKGLFKREHSKNRAAVPIYNLQIIAETFRQTTSPFIWMGHSLCK